MPFQVVCSNPQCRKAIHIQGDPAGKALRCPACNTVLSVTPAGSRPKDRPTIHASSSAKQGTMEAPSAKQPAPEPRAPAPKPAGAGRKEGLPAGIGPYQISRELGRGAFGVVYQGHDPKLKRDVAIKVLNKDALSSARAVERFLREARVVAQMHHGHIVPVYELGEHDGCHYIASRFVPGRTLADLVPEGGLEPAEAVRLVLQLLEALAYAHEMNVLHRDVKAANAIVDTKGHLYLMDFGLAGWVGQTEGRATKDGTVMGTPAYMPPEQARGDIQHLSAASDQYSAGVVLYELLTGRVPFEGGPPLALLYNVIETPPPRPSGFRLGLDPQLEALCLRALAKKPEERFGSCLEFAEALRTWQAGRGSATAVVVPQVAEGLPEVIPLQVDRVPAQETAVRVPEPPRRRKARRPPKAGSFFAKRWPWVLSGAAVMLALGLAVLLFALGSGTLRRIGKEGSEKQQQPAVWNATKPGDVSTNTLGMRFAFVPAGSFWMGGGDGKPGDKQVTIANDFFLGVHPVTQAEWRLLMADSNPDPSWFSRRGGGAGVVKDVSDADLARFPVEQVTWDDTQVFITGLNERERGSGWMYRLPTEAEWEYACRGRASSKEDCSFSFYFIEPTNDLSSDQANFDGRHPAGNGKPGIWRGCTTKVGSFEANRLGLFDMHGNVWQWCNDASGSGRVLRGGSWKAGQGCRAAYRISRAPWFRNSDVGLRLALVPVR